MIMPDAAPLDGIDLLLADLDGVVYRGDTAVPFAIESLNKVSDNIQVAYLTNNASRTPLAVAGQLNALGLGTKATDIVTSPQAAVRLLRTLISPGEKVLAVGGDGLIQELLDAGYLVTAAASDSPSAVVQGFAKSVGWEELAEASFALQGAGAERPWIATNSDWTLPTDRGIAPGNGTLVSAVHLATGRMPLIAGKPETALFEVALERFVSNNALMIGDRLDTDILGASRAGLRSALVLTGVDQAKQVLAAEPSMRPTYILQDLRGLFEPYPLVDRESDGDGSKRYSVKGSTVQMLGNRVQILESGSSKLDLLRAACAAVWESGLAIYGLEIPQQIYA
ncbi:MAG: HAD-IIA family hydrolase [Cryobacterium sp.]|nr:HAD-IIA family hydrolase [Cryobacterium sp.]